MPGSCHKNCLECYQHYSQSHYALVESSLLPLLPDRLPKQLSSAILELSCINCSCSGEIRAAAGWIHWNVSAQYQCPQGSVLRLQTHCLICQLCNQHVKLGPIVAHCYNRRKGLTFLAANTVPILNDSVGNPVPDAGHHFPSLKGFKIAVRSLNQTVTKIDATRFAFKLWTSILLHSWS